jgi:hypothetical protein
LVLARTRGLAMGTKAQELLQAARDEAARVETWADLSNFLFDSDEGIVTKAFPVGPERRKFMRSPEYQAIRELIKAVQDRTGFIEGATPKRIVMQRFLFPRSLHAALEAEAQREGVSLNQLVVAKLSVSMAQMVSANRT